MKRPLIFVGSRQCLVELAWIAELNNIEVLGVLDHHYLNKDIEGIPVLGDERILLDQSNNQAMQWLRTCDFFPGNWHDGAQYNNKQLDLQNLRLQRIDILERSGASIINLIHPDSCLPGTSSRYANYKIGRGVQIHAKVLHGASNIKIGDFCAFSHGSVCGHDVELGKNVLIGPDTYLYDCQIGDDSYVGIYSRMNSIKNKKKITVGKNVTIWNDAMVTKDIPDNCIYTTNGRILTKQKNKNKIN